jgi:hypothetical protein
MVYGLHRTSALRRVDVYAYVREPDNLLLAELAVLGEFRQVPEVLWKRRFAVDETRRRHLGSLFTDSPPWYAHLPPWIQHTPRIAARQGLAVALWFALASFAEMIRRWLRSAYRAVSPGRTEPAPERRPAPRGR